MRIIGEVSWNEDVLAAWRRAANNAPRPNSDVWRELPGQGREVSWYEARVESDDLIGLFVIGSGDWGEVFGTYRVVEIAEQANGVDVHDRHREKIMAIAEAIRGGMALEPPICVSDSLSGPFTFLDGNHRAVAYLLRGELIDLRVYLGLDRRIRSEFYWASPAYEARRVEDS